MPNCIGHHCNINLNDDQCRWLSDTYLCLRLAVIAPLFLVLLVRYKTMRSFFRADTTDSTQTEKFFFDFFNEKMQKNVRSLSSPALAAAATEPSLHSRHEYSFQPLMVEDAVNKRSFCDVMWNLK